LVAVFNVHVSSFRTPLDTCMKIIPTFAVRVLRINIPMKTYCSFQAVLWKTVRYYMFGKFLSNICHFIVEYFDTTNRLNELMIQRLLVPSSLQDDSNLYQLCASKVVITDMVIHNSFVSWYFLTATVLELRFMRVCFLVYFLDIAWIT
jgi:hypothetical protein